MSDDKCTRRHPNPRAKYGHSMTRWLTGGDWPMRACRWCTYREYSVVGG